MTLTPFQLQNPLKPASTQKTLSYLERSFSRADREEMAQWFDNGVAGRALRNELRTTTPYGEYLGRLFLAGAKSNDWSQEDTLTWWRRIWDAGGETLTGAYDTWLARASGSVADFLVEHGANPHASYRDNFGTTTPALTLLKKMVQSERRTNSSEPVDPTDDARIAQWIDQTPVGDPGLSGMLAQVVWGFAASLDQDNPDPAWQVRSDALLAKSGPIFLAMEVLMRTLSQAQTGLGSHDQSNFIKSLGDIPYSQALKQLTAHEQAITQRKMKALLGFGLGMAETLPKQGLSQEWEIGHWRELLSLPGCGPLARRLMDSGFTPWTVQFRSSSMGRHDTQSHPYTVLTETDGTRFHGALRGLAEIQGHPARPPAAWVENAAVGFLKAPNSRPAGQAITAGELDTLMAWCDWDAKTRNHLDSAISVWMRTQAQDTEINETVVRPMVAALARHGLFNPLLKEDEASLDAARLQRLNSVIGGWVGRPSLAKLLREEAQSSELLPVAAALLEIQQADPQRRMAWVDEALAAQPNLGASLILRVLDTRSGAGLSTSDMNCALGELFEKGVRLTEKDQASILEATGRLMTSALVYREDDPRGVLGARVIEALIRLGMEPGFDDSLVLRKIITDETLAPTNGLFAQRLGAVFQALFAGGADPAAVAELPQRGPAARLVAREHERRRMEANTAPVAPGRRGGMRL